ncbi:hypothetical protein PybrP1_005192 [[Pythium] brassicae (nom. inval.)]|nr:hypothetical protein PybrP1_005192 [[Pythium] brassicae (nom. inval.)]
MKAKIAREATLERMKIVAAHANDTAMLQNKIEELKETVLLTEARAARESTFLERYSAFAARRVQNDVRWVACGFQRC